MAVVAQQEIHTMVKYDNEYDIRHAHMLDTHFGTESCAAKGEKRRRGRGKKGGFRWESGRGGEEWEGRRGRGVWQRRDWKRGREGGTRERGEVKGVDGWEGV